nr:tRNA-splicing endonuclease subunit Sen2 [Cryptomonas paramecium]
MITRRWNFKYNRESKKKIKFHGKFINNFGWISCRFSIFFISNNTLGNHGKGTLSRSQASYSNSNPCFNSIGKAGREKKSIKNIFTKGWIFENFQLDLTEMLFLIKKKQFKSFCIFSPKYTIKIFTAKKCTFYWKLFMLDKYQIFGWFLKSGIKYGGNFAVYKNKYQFHGHFHSKLISFVENLWLLENNCTKCTKKCYSFLLNKQTNTRLSQQVSKYFTYSYSLPYKKTFIKSISHKIQLNRWVFN